MKIDKRTQGIIEEINKANLEIPFGNSKFQNENFVLASELTPARAYRHCLLRLNDRISALRECYYSLQIEDIDIEEMQEKSINETTDKFEKRRLAIRIEQKKVNRISTEKMIKDCYVEIETLYNAFDKLPKFTRAEFEAEEREHYELKLSRDLVLGMQFGGSSGVAKSLEDIGENSESKIKTLSNDPAKLRKIISKNQRLIVGDLNE